MTAKQTIGIIGAIPQEINGIIDSLQNVTQTQIANRIYYKGTIGDQDVVVVYSRIGKVAAATTVTTLLLNFDVSKVIFIGVAGAIHQDVQVGDVVVASNLVQYDMDVSPLRPKFEIPLLGKTFFETDLQWSNQLVEQIQQILDPKVLHTLISKEDLEKFQISSPKVHFGMIASGDQFFSTMEQKDNLQQALPQVMCVEMEGAAVAQVCFEFGVDFTVIRTISDNANQHASFSFQSFVEQVSLIYGKEIIQKVLA
ncbi:5'-methylthioadenosine/adenosylhomocysteine nucleosidase [Myroides sp. LJL116]